MHRASTMIKVGDLVADPRDRGPQGPGLVLELSDRGLHRKPNIWVLCKFHHRGTGPSGTTYWLPARELYIYEKKERSKR